MLIGPAATEPALVGFAGYLQSCAIPYLICSDLAHLGFGISMERDGSRQTRMHLPGFGIFSGEEVGVFVRNPSSFLQRGRSRQARFIAKEYYSSLWTLCALLPRVINRPGRWAWLYDRELKYLLPDTKFLPEYWTTDFAELPNFWERSETPEMHIEDLLTFRRTICSQQDDLTSWKRRRSAVQLRALVAPSSEYIIHICVGNWHITILNEPGYEVDSPQHLSYLSCVSEVVRQQGIRFFAVVFVVDKGQLFLTRIQPEPPFAWYREQANDVHEQLFQELRRPFPPERGVR